jgi:hypothetical protein
VPDKYWQILAQQLGEAFFPRLVCQPNILNPILRKGKVPSITQESIPARLSAAITTPLQPGA